MTGTPEQAMVTGCSFDVDGWCRAHAGECAGYRSAGGDEAEDPLETKPPAHAAS